MQHSNFISRVQICYDAFLGLVVQDLTASLINVSLKFQVLISEMCQYFLLKKFGKLLQSLNFSTKNISVFSIKVLKHLKELIS